MGLRPADVLLEKEKRKAAANAQANEIIRQQKEERDRIEAERQQELWNSSENAGGIDLDEIMEKKKLERIKERTVGKLKEEKGEEKVVGKELGEKEEEERIEEREVKIRERELRLREAEFAAEEKRRAADEEAAQAAASKAKRQKAWNTTKKVGSGLMTNLAVNPIKKADAMMHGEAPKSIVSLFWLAVIFHAFLMVLWIFSGINSFSLMYISMGLYVILILIALFAYSKAGLLASSRIGVFIGLSLVSVIIPLFLSWVPDITVLGPTTLRQWVFWIVVWFPLWPIYIGIIDFNIPFARFYVLLWLIGILVLLFFKFGLNISPANLIALGARPADVSEANAVFTYLTDEAKSTFTKFITKIGDPKNWLNKTESYFGLNYYTSTIDGTEEEPVGFYITGVKSEDKYFYEGSPATVVADIRGKSFTDELFVVPSCYIDKKGDGVATPDSFHILGEEQSSFYCRFTDLTKGSYTAKVSATFDFETWAYLEYNFVDLEVKRSFDAKHESVNTALNIPTTTKSISTPGPVNLGMASSGLTQPILIDRAYNTRKPAIGASVLNQWTDGQIGEVYQFVLMVPDDFSLVDCTRGTPIAQANENITGYTDYIFTRDVLGDPRLTFEQVRCFLQLKDPNSFFAGGAQKVKRTFIGKVKYRYKLEKSVSLIVKP